jgi:hypothetical protein
MQRLAAMALANLSAYPALQPQLVADGLCREILDRD